MHTVSPLLTATTCAWDQLTQETAFRLSGNFPRQFITPPCWKTLFRLLCLTTILPSLTRLPKCVYTRACHHGGLHPVSFVTVILDQTSAPTRRASGHCHETSGAEPRRQSPQQVHDESSKSKRSRVIDMTFKIKASLETPVGEKKRDEKEL